MFGFLNVRDEIVQLVVGVGGGSGGMLHLVKLEISVTGAILDFF